MEAVVGDRAGFPRVFQMVLNAKTYANELSSKILVYIAVRCMSPESNKHVPCGAARQQKSHKRTASLFRVY